MTTETRVFIEKLRSDLHEEAKKFAGCALDWQLVTPGDPRCRAVLVRLVEDAWTLKALRDRCGEALRLLGFSRDAAEAEARLREKIAGYRHSAEVGEDVKNPYVRALRDYARQQRREEENRRFVARTLRQAMRGRQS